jgi:hypothetical protein
LPPTLEKYFRHTGTITMAFIAGAYSAYWGASATDNTRLGMIEDGFDLSYSKQGELILTDTGGDTPMNGVYKGVDMTVSFTLTELNLAGVNSLLWPFSATRGELGAIGRLDSVMAQPLVLTACYPPSAGATIPATITFHATLIENEADIMITHGNRHRKAAVTMRVYPVAIAAPGTGVSCYLMRLFTAT